MEKKKKTNVPPRNDDIFLDSQSVVSSTECTGLMQTPPISEEEADSYTDLYGVPKPGKKVDNGLQHK